LKKRKRKPKPRTAEAIYADYSARGYSHERLRAIGRVMADGGNRIGEELLDLLEEQR